MANLKENIEQYFTPQNFALLSFDLQKKWWKKEKQRWEAIERHIMEVREKYPKSGEFYENLLRQREQEIGAMLVSIREAVVKKVVEKKSSAYHPAQTVFE